MDTKRDQEPGRTQKALPAQTHGQEWVTFYESFDKLVQDNLSRSSDLLRRAMALPEVADREVAQIRGELEGKLAAERAKHKETLSTLREDVAAGQRQVSVLARGVGSILADLERLTQRVADALAALDVAEAPAPVAPSSDVNGTNGHASVVEAPVGENAAADEAIAEVSAEIEAVAVKNAEIDEALATVAAAVEESAPAEVGEATADAGEAATGERARPHWLSVTRAGSRG